MAFELYLQNIKTLAKFFGFTSPIELDDNLGAIFICNQEDPFLLNIHYCLEKNVITIDTLVATHMPSSRLGIQTLMNEILGDLLQKNYSGRLVAYPEEFAVKYLHEIHLDSAQENSLALAIPHFIQEALKWKAKFKTLRRPAFFSPCGLKPQEIISFETF